MLPGIGKIKKQLDAANIDETILKRQRAMIGSMTKAERKNPKLLNASRKKRVAAGSGTSVQDINKLVKMHRQMADMMKQMGKLGEKGLMRGGLSALFGGAGGMVPRTPPQTLPPLGGALPGLGGGLPGLPGKKR
jgi:signal recognition particle subunit SRP54